MKKIILFFAVIFLFFSSTTYIAFAFKVATHSKAIGHPGRTDRYGCHRCRTNCYRWGLGYGEYHCH